MTDWFIRIVGIGVLMSVGAGCGHHVQLLFPPNNATAEHFRCAPAEPKARPEHRTPRCTALAGGPSAEVGNTGETVRIDVPDCPGGAYKTITIMDADESDPTVYVTCGQRSHGHNLEGDDDAS